MPKHLDLDRIFTYHRPFGTQNARYEAIREFAKRFAKMLIDNTPPSAEQTLSVRYLQQSVQMANAAIAINEREPAEAEVVGVAEGA